MPEQTCPNCDAPLPDELSQHAENLAVGLVTCPSCGAKVTLREASQSVDAAGVERAAAAPPGQTENRETFAGNETMAGLQEELEQK